MLKNKILGIFAVTKIKPDLILVIASVFLFIVGLKPFHLGLWFQSEPVTLALFVLAALTAVICFFCKSTVSGFIEATHHPVVGVLFGIALLSAIQSIFLPFPVRSFFGAPEIGEGIFSWLALAVLTAGAYQIWQKASNRRAIIVSISIASISAVALQRLSSTIDWQPAKWPDFASFIAIFVMIILIAAPRRLTRKRLGMAAGVGIVVAVLSNSLSFWLILLSLPAIGYGLRHLRKRMTNKQRFMDIARRIFIGMAMLPLLITVISFNASFMRGMNDTIGGLLQIRNMKDFPFEQGSLGTRVLFNHVGLDAIVDNPSWLLTGAGWGSFSDTLFRYVFTEDIYIYNDKATWDPNWYMIAGSAFHPHNAFMEMLLSMGIGGLVLFCLLPIIIIRQLPNERLLILAPLWASAFLLNGFWFMLPVALPFMAIAFAASMRPPERIPSTTLAHYTPLRVRMVCALLVALFSLAIWVQYSTANSAGKLITAIQQRMPEPADSATLRDHGRGNTHLWWIALNISQYVNQKVQGKTPTKEADVLWFNEILGMVGQTIIKGDANARLHGHYLFMHNDLITLYNIPMWYQLQTDRLAHWKTVMVDGLQAIPTRGDMAFQYYNFFSQRIKPTESAETNLALAERVLAVSEEALKNNPEDMTALWFSGLAMLQKPETTKLGLKRLYKVLDDFDGWRYVPIDPLTREKINFTRRN